MTDHPQSVHSLWSPSAAARWINCPGSINLCRDIPEPPSSFYARWGTDCHKLAEDIFKQPQTNYVQADPEMLDVARQFVDYCLSLGCTNYKSEQRVSLEAFLLPDIYGTADFIGTTSDNVLHVVDLKTGKGVRVSAENNSQLKIYALGATDGWLINYNKIVCHIFQPRVEDGITSATYTPEELSDWLHNILIPAYKATLSLVAPLIPGSYCRWCRAAGICSANADHSLALAQLDFKRFTPPPVDTLTDAQLTAIMLHRKDIEAWLKAVDVYVKDLPRLPKGLKMVEGRRSKAWKGQSRVEQWLRGKTYRRDVLETKLRSPAQIKKLLKGTKWEKQIEQFIEVKPGKPTITAADDKREAIQSTAELDFAEFVQKGGK